jgi:hypothetical protein
MAIVLTGDNGFLVPSRWKAVIQTHATSVLTSRRIRAAL